MFTFRAVRHADARADDDPNGYDVHQAESYVVKYRSARTQVILKDPKYGDTDGYLIEVGPASDFVRVFVMNAAGQTVDTIR